MDILKPVSLSSSGRPIFHEEEVEIKTYESVHALSGTKDDNETVLVADSLCTLSNIKIYFVTKASKSNDSNNNYTGLCFNLQLINSFEDCSGFFRRSRRVKLIFSHTTARKEMDIKFLDGQKEEFMELLQRVLDRKSWLLIKAPSIKQTMSNHPNQSATSQTQQVDPKPSFSAHNAGISGIIRRQEQNMQNMDQLTKTALTDLNHLIDKARDVVQHVQRYAAYMQENNPKLRGTGPNDVDAFSETSTQVNERYEIENMMQEIGIISPVTKLSSGRLYHEQLAREISDVLLQNKRIERLGGMITLTDLYCLINRIHGTDLVSPNDLLRSCEVIHSLNLGLKLREFEKTNVKVIQLHVQGDSDQVFARRIIQLIESHSEFQENGVSASDIVLAFNTSFVIAKEVLIIAEQSLFLCRDESVEGIRFFINRFR